MTHLQSYFNHNEDVVMAPSVKAFESRLDKLWNNQPVKFSHKEERRL